MMKSISHWGIIKVPATVLSTSQPLSAEQVAKLRAAWDRAYAGHGSRLVILNENE